MLRFSPPGECESKSRCRDGNLEQRFFGFIVIVKSLKQNKTKLMGNFCCSPFSLSRCGVLRQGFDKFYSVSFQARRSLVCHFQEFLARLKANLVTNFSFPPPLVEELGEHQKISILLPAVLFLLRMFFLYLPRISSTV
jgi:hypothetical protein